MRFTVLYLVVALLALLLLISCASGDSKEQQDVSGDTGLVTDTGTGIQDTGQEKEIMTVDTGPPDTGEFQYPAGCQGGPVKGNLPPGAECAAHDECDTGWCYNEAYLGANVGGLRFCSARCDLNCACADWEAAENTVTCIRFYQAEIDGYGMNVAAICVPECNSADQCAQRFGSTYTRCELPRHLDGGETIGAAKSCLQ